MTRKTEVAVTVFVELVLIASLVLLCWATAGCEAPVPDYTTDHGIMVFDNTTDGADQTEIEIIAELAIRVSGHGDVDLRGAELTLRDDPCEWLHADGWRKCNGSCLEGSVCVWAGQDQCLGRTSLGHELLHLAEWAATDYEGTNVELKERSQALWQMTKHVCGGDE